MSSEPLRTNIKRFCVAVVFSIAFAYIESAVVVYLREIFYPDGFVFPLVNFGDSILWRRVLITEIGREAATIVLILTAAWLFSRGRQQRAAYFLIIFAVWDIFYYVWLKVLVDWPGSIMDWDILFLIPLVWASPVLAPVLVSILMFVFGGVILCRGPVKVTVIDGVCFTVCGLVVVVSFCIAGVHIGEPNYSSFFYWPLFAIGIIPAVVVFGKSILQTAGKDQVI